MNKSSKGLDVTYRLASPGRRCLGETIDLFVSASIFVVALWATSFLGLSNDDASLIALLGAAAYFLLSDGLFNGQSIGKKFLQISVIHQSTGEKCSYLQSFFRNLLGAIIGVFDAVFILGKKRQRLGDKLAKTIVVRN